MAETFVGWVPTALGRLSFSRIGDEFQKHAVVSSVPGLGGPAGIFGAKRTVEDLSTSVWDRILGKGVDVTDYAFFLETISADLPYPCKHSPKHGPSCAVKLEPTTAGALQGRVYFTQSARGVFARGPAVKGLALLRDTAVSGAKPQSDRWAGYRGSERRVAAAWRLMRLRLLGRGAISNFGEADVLLLRTGECRVTLREDRQSLLLGMAKYSRPNIVHQITFQNFQRMFLEDSAEGVFRTIRDLVHKHYHHDGDNYVFSPVARVTAQDDSNWRRQTRDGLMRMCMAERRKGHAASLRNALGILAYVDAFDRHLARWYLRNGRPVDGRQSAAYDFSALKASIDAGLKARELADQTIRQRLLFAFGFMVTVITLLAPIFREPLTKAVSSSQPLTPHHFLTDALGFMARHPVASLAAAAGFGWLFDLAVTRLSITRLDTVWQAVTTKAADKFIATLRQMKVGSRLSQWIAVGVLGGGILALIGVWLNIAIEVVGSASAYIDSVRGMFR